jgi:hypothetical protein
MIHIQNHISSIGLILAHILETKMIPVIDLDEVIFCAKQRQRLYSQSDVDAKKCHADRIGQLDLDHYLAHSKGHLIAQDKNLPLIGLVHALNELGIEYHVATARVICLHSEKLLKDRKVLPKLIMSRGADGDYRKDDVLKVDHMRLNFCATTRRNLLLIDDNVANCKAYEREGASALHVVAC